MTDPKNPPTATKKPTKPAKVWAKLLGFFVLVLLVSAGVMGYQGWQRYLSQISHFADADEVAHQQQQLTQTMDALVQQIAQLRDRPVTNESSRSLQWARIDYFLYHAIDQIELHRSIHEITRTLNFALKLCQGLTQCGASAQQMLNLSQQLQSSVFQVQRTARDRFHQIEILIKKLPLKIGMRSPTQIAQPSNNWQENLKASLMQFKNIVEIRRHDSAVVPLLTANERLMLQLNMSALLLQAQNAFEQYDMPLFKQSWERLAAALHQYYQLDNASAKQLLELWQSLAKVNLTEQQQQLQNIRDALSNIIMLHQQQAVS